MRFLVRFGFLTVLVSVVSEKPACVIEPHGRSTPGATGIAGWQLAPARVCDSCENAAWKLVVFLSATVLLNEPLLFVVRRSEEHTSELQSHHDIVCRLLLE